MDTKTAQLFFEKFIGEKAQEFSVLQQSGSARINYLGQSSSAKYIITFNENLRENEAFFYFSEIFAQLELNSPKILEINETRTLYLQEFLGENTLSEVIEKEGHSENVKLLTKRTISQLFDFQQKTAGKIDFTKSFEYEKYNELPILHDLYYFKNFMVDVLEIPYHKSTLLKEFKKIVEKIENLEPKTLMIRDFQARNIMIDHQKVSFIDYQTAMEGPAMYDVVSFIFQAKANFPEIWKNEMLDFYISLWKDEEKSLQLKDSLKYCILIRYLQVLGAYGFRGLIQRKFHFLKSIDQGIKNLAEFTENWREMQQYPELRKLILGLNTDFVKNKISIF